ncbi:tumor protein p53-inducible protein 11-like [Styela clava]
MQSIQSRMKSRKILGVGEAADGQLHRSKITQILGNDSLTNWQIARAEYPVGLQALQWLSCLWFSSIGLISLFSPESILPPTLLKSVDISEQDATPNRDLLVGMRLSLISGTRLYGAAMVALASLCLIVTLANWQSRRAIRIALLVQGIFCTSEILASFLSGPSHWDQISRHPLICCTIRILVSVASFYYFKQTRPCTHGIMKRASE